MPGSGVITSAEQEISAFHDWSWNFETYLLSLDSMYKDRIQQGVDRPIDHSGLNAAEKTRSTRLYALLVGLTRNRAASIVRAVQDTNGFEAWRQLLVTLKPHVKARGLAFAQWHHKLGSL